MLQGIQGHSEVDRQIHFLTNHALVLASIGRDKTIRMREIASSVKITERAVQRIVDELVLAGFVEIRKSGRRNVYSVNETRTLGSQMPRCPVSDLLSFCGN